jgi:exodeoxyribonuclease VII large subunit
MEDLWAFNEETVVREIFASEIPIISAVGHEVDTSLSDLVADLRAPTPSAAAELVSTDSKQLVEKLTTCRNHLQRLIIKNIERTHFEFSQLDHRLKLNDPLQQLLQQQQRKDALDSSLINSGHTKLNQNRQKIHFLNHRLKQQTPAQQIEQNKQRLSQLNWQFSQLLTSYSNQKQQNLSKVAHALNLVSPLATISRGYSISKNKQGSIIRSVGEIKEGELLVSQLSDGQVHSEVKKVIKNNA